jgi:hypothetical protein
LLAAALPSPDRFDLEFDPKSPLHAWHRLLEPDCQLTNKKQSQSPR